MNTCYLETGLLCMSLTMSSSAVTSDGDIRSMFTVVVQQNGIIQSVHVSFLSGVSKVSPQFTLERFVETTTPLALMLSYSMENRDTL